jgi:SAM-dependent methyltransferase
MASSFVIQIPIIIDVVKALNPKSILDIGKGFGKYGFLVHEYIGIDNTLRLSPEKSLQEQSRIVMDACEADTDLLLPHLPHLYRNLFVGDVLEKYKFFQKYDLILMIDVIEHLNKEKSIEMLRYFVSQKSRVLIATPKDFFEQHLYESEFENHISHWKVADFEKIGFVDYQKIDSGMLYLLSADKIDIRGFGDSFIKKLRRIGRALRNEL